jgi:hypothetical protein
VQDVEAVEKASAKGDVRDIEAIEKAGAKGDEL